MSEEGVDMAGATSDLDEWEACGTAILMPADSSAEVAVILQVEDVPAGIVLAIFGSSQLYVRMRNGPLAFGLAEPFRQRESSHPLERGPAVITNDDHYIAHFDQSATLFGAQDTVVLMPFAASGKPHARVSIPMMSVERPRRAVYELDGGGRGERWSYTFVEEVTLNDGYVCPVCGKFCESAEPHSSKHGVPGHFVTGTVPGRPGNEANSFGNQYRGIS